eukprot:GGOE01009705.1.p2 GENE.GGOE01009705.1~~GGOE01009705.1.p2  ORF type:complete len:116 (-),score=3.01 GGOE01009705.1:356-703(-)
MSSQEELTDALPSETSPYTPRHRPSPVVASPPRFPMQTWAAIPLPILAVDVRLPSRTSSTRALLGPLTWELAVCLVSGTDGLSPFTPLTLSLHGPLEHSSMLPARISGRGLFSTC